MSIDQRHDRRYTSHTDGTIHFSGQTYRIITQDIAQSGLSLEIEAPFSVAPALGDQVTLLIPAQDTAAQEVKMEAEVRWSKATQNSGLILGIHFIANK